MARKHFIFAEWKKYDTAEGVWYYGSPLDEISRSDNKSIVILTPDGYRDIKDELDDHIAIYIYANNKTIRSRLSKRGDKKEEADRRIKQDNEDFKNVEILADRIFYNNGAKVYSLMPNFWFMKSTKSLLLSTSW